MKSMELVRGAGITYRQFDHWIRRGYIKGGTPGSGNARDLDETETAVLALMSTLVKSGMFPARAAQTARTMIEGAG